MTLHVFPSNTDLPGIEWNVTKAPIFSTRVLTARSGKEYRTPNWSFNRYKWQVSFSVLRDGRNGIDELKTLLGFCLARMGMYETFLYSDPNDNAVTDQLLGVGTGSQLDFPLVRTFGEWTDPNLVANAITHVYVNGIEQTLTTDYTIQKVGSFGLDTIRFISPPPYGEDVTATFSYYFPVRFLQDDPEFENIFYKMWAMKKLQFWTDK